MFGLNTSARGIILCRAEKFMWGRRRPEKPNQSKETELVVAGMKGCLVSYKGCDGEDQKKRDLGVDEQSRKRDPAPSGRGPSTCPWGGVSHLKKKAFI